MKLLFILVFILILPLQIATAKEFRLSKEVLNSKSIPFIAHKGKGPFSSYLAMNIPFPPMADLFKQLLIQQKTKMTNRGEAHITVITPVEYFQVLKKHLNIDEINSIAKAMQIQKTIFSIKGIGMGKKTLKGRAHKTFYVLVVSKKLIEIRTAIQKAYIKAGGKASDFNPKLFYPHITLGYTQRDLHLSDGIKKDLSSFWQPLTLF